ncbi:thioredoxin, partial [human gut metagenome]
DVFEIRQAKDLQNPMDGLILPGGESTVIGKLLLADFYSDSCIPCKRLSPVLFELEKEYEGKLKIAKINVNFDSELASEYEVQAAPTLVFFKNGEEKERLRGAVKKSEIIEVTEKLIKE